MPAAATGNQRDFARKRRVAAGNKDRVAVQAQLWMRGDEALQLFVKDGFYLIDELFHNILPLMKGNPQKRTHYAAADGK